MVRDRPKFPMRPIPLHDFMSEEIVWHPVDYPWFNVTIRIADSRCSVPELFMVPTLGHLKKLLIQQNDNFKVESIEYVTPSSMNGTGQWKIERLTEVTELFNEEGWSIPRCRVNNHRVYRGISLEPAEEWPIERPVYFES